MIAQRLLAVSAWLVLGAAATAARQIEHRRAAAFHRPGLGAPRAHLGNCLLARRQAPGLHPAHHRHGRQQGPHQHLAGGDRQARRRAAAHGSCRQFQRRRVERRRALRLLPVEPQRFHPGVAGGGGRACAPRRAASCLRCAGCGRAAGHQPAARCRQLPGLSQRRPHPGERPGVFGLRGFRLHQAAPGRGGACQGRRRSLPRVDRAALGHLERRPAYRSYLR